ncbi:MAG: hypothetical protein J5737_04955 [Bacteroidales bacterium]|nr:hypothetical protein [Bacteroidales bacterium]
MRNYLLFIASVSLLLSCSGKEYLDWNRPVTGDEGFSHDEIVLGEKLQDPYSVENMTKALISVHPSASGRATLEPTHFYVRFLPADASQMQVLTDLGLELLDHPLDYRIVREGDWYHDPSVPEGEITWQYGVVPVSFEFPQGIRYERLDDCYLPENDPSTKAADGIDWDAVECEAYRITGNEDMLQPATKDGEISVRANPQGRIAILDPAYDEDPVGVKGVKVCCNSFVKFATCYTDDEGYYRMSKSFSTDPRYRLVFRNVRGFSQGVNFILLPASVSTFGRQPSAGYSVTLDSFSDRRLFMRCVVNNAGYDYIDASRKSSGAISAPPRDLRIWLLDMFGFDLPTMMHHGVLMETMATLADMPKEITMLIKIIQQDVILGLSGEESYQDVYRRALRVFAYSGHFNRTDKDWWWNYLQYVARSLVESTLQDGFGSRGDSGFEYAEVANTYAFYCENVLCRQRYPGYTDFDGTTSWFFPQLLMYLDDRGLGLDKLSPMFTSDIADMESLRAKLLSYYPQFKTVINEAYARYRD